MSNNYLRQPVRKLIEPFLQWRVESSKNPNTFTINNQRHRLERLAAFFQELPIGNINQNTIEKYRESRLSLNEQEKTTRRYINDLSLLFFFIGIKNPDNQAVIYCKSKGWKVRGPHGKSPNPRDYFKPNQPKTKNKTLTEPPIAKAVQPTLLGDIKEYVGMSKSEKKKIKRIIILEFK
jgi:hypothetical protein